MLDANKVTNLMKSGVLLQFHTFGQQFVLQFTVSFSATKGSKSVRIVWVSLQHGADLSLAGSTTTRPTTTTNVKIQVTPSQPLRGHFTKSTNKNVTRLLSQWRCTISQQETVPDLRPPNDWRKRWDLVSRRNVSIEEAALVCGGRLFHAHAADTGNARSPRVDRRVDGTSNVGESTERRRRRFWGRGAGF